MLERYDTSLALKQTLRTEYADESRFLTVTDFRFPLQAFCNHGVSAVFLSRYYMYSGNAQAREYAKTVLPFAGYQRPQR